MAHDKNDLMIIAPNGDDKIPQYKQTIPVNIYHFYITDEIGDPREFLDLINILKTAEEHDTIFIYLNTPGGSLQTTIQIIGAIEQCQGTVVTCLEGEVCSAGTLIFLVADRHIVNSHSTFMVHNYSQWLGGKGNEVAIRVKYSEQYFKKLAYDIYGGFLSDDEINAMLDGKDYWLTSDMVIERLNIRNELMEKEMEKMNASSIKSEKLEAVTEKVIEQEQKPVKIPKPKKSTKT